MTCSKAQETLLQMVTSDGGTIVLLYVLTLESQLAVRIPQVLLLRGVIYT